MLEFNGNERRVAEGVARYAHYKSPESLIELVNVKPTELEREKHANSELSLRLRWNGAGWTNVFDDALGSGSAVQSRLC